tara:strand:- start:14414 stop:17314 length:2901 start_codon:yes stop_codon:yes gene_type:complete
MHILHIIKADNIYETHTFNLSILPSCRSFRYISVEKKVVDFSLLHNFKIISEINNIITYSAELKADLNENNYFLWNKDSINNNLYGDWSSYLQHPGFKNYIHREGTDFDPPDPLLLSGNSPTYCSSDEPSGVMINKSYAPNYLIHKDKHCYRSYECFDPSFENYSMNKSFNQNSQLYEKLWDITGLKPATYNGKKSTTCIDASSLYHWNKYSKTAFKKYISKKEQPLWDGIFEEKQYYYWPNHYDPLLFIWWLKNPNTEDNTEANPEIPDSRILKAGGGAYQNGWINRTKNTYVCSDYNYVTNNNDFVIQYTWFGDLPYSKFPLYNISRAKFPKKPTTNLDDITSAEYVYTHRSFSLFLPGMRGNTTGSYNLLNGYMSFDVDTTQWAPILQEKDNKWYNVWFAYYLSSPSMVWQNFDFSDGPIKIDTLENGPYFITNVGKNIQNIMDLSMFFSKDIYTDSRSFVAVDNNCIQSPRPGLEMDLLENLDWIPGSDDGYQARANFQLRGARRVGVSDDSNKKDHINKMASWGGTDNIEDSDWCGINNLQDGAMNTCWRGWAPLPRNNKYYPSNLSIMDGQIQSYPRWPQQNGPKDIPKRNANTNIPVFYLARYYNIKADFDKDANVIFTITNATDDYIRAIYNGNYDTSAKMWPEPRIFGINYISFRHFPKKYDKYGKDVSLAGMEDSTPYGFKDSSTQYLAPTQDTGNGIWYNIGNTPQYLGNEASKAALKANMILDGVQLTFSSEIGDHSDNMPFQAKGTKANRGNIYEYQKEEHSEPWFPVGNPDTPENYHANWIEYDVKNPNFDSLVRIRNMEIKGIQVQKQRKWERRDDPRCNMGCKSKPEPENGLVICNSNNTLPYYYYPCPHKKVKLYKGELEQPLWNITGPSNTTPFITSLKNLNGHSDGRQYKLNQQIIADISKSLSDYAKNIGISNHKIMNLSNIYKSSSVLIKVDKRPYSYSLGSSSD